MKDHLIQVIDELNEEYVKIWEDICNIESPWSCKEGVDAVGQYLNQTLDQHISRCGKLHFWQFRKIGSFLQCVRKFC